MIQSGFTEVKSVSEFAQLSCHPLRQHPMALSSQPPVTKLLAAPETATLPSVRLPDFCKAPLLYLSANQ